MRKLSYLKRLLLSDTIPLFCKGNAEFLEVGLPVHKKKKKNTFNDFIQTIATFFFSFLFLVYSMVSCLIYHGLFRNSFTILPSLQHGIINVRYGLFLNGHNKSSDLCLSSWLLSFYPFSALLFSFCDFSVLCWLSISVSHCTEIASWISVLGNSGKLT